MNDLCSFDLDLDPMTLVYEFTVDVLTVYTHTTNKVSRSSFQKLEHAQDRQTDRQTQTDRHTDETKRITSCNCGWNITTITILMCFVIIVDERDIG